MSISARLQEYIEEIRLPWNTVPHRSSIGCMDSAHSAHVPPDHVAKAVVLKGRRGGYVMAVIPANQRVDLAGMAERLRDDVGLVSERQLSELFPDCSIGAVPPVGEAYGLTTFWDPRLAEWADVYFEGGDHRTLVHMNGADFARLMGGARPIA